MSCCCAVLVSAIGRRDQTMNLSDLCSSCSSQFLAFSFFFYSVLFACFFSPLILAGFGDCDWSP